MAIGASVPERRCHAMVPNRFHPRIPSPGYCCASVVRQGTGSRVQEAPGVDRAFQQIRQTLLCLKHSQNPVMALRVQGRHLWGSDGIDVYRGTTTRLMISHPLSQSRCSSDPIIVVRGLSCESYIGCRVSLDMRCRERTL